MRVSRFIASLRPYEGGKPIEETERELNIKQPIKLASNENPLGPSKNAVLAIGKKISSINMYPDGDAYYLKEKLAQKLHVSKDNIIFGNGSDELIELIYKTFATENNDEIVYCFPTFIEYKIIGASFNKILRELQLKDFSYDVNAIVNSLNRNTRIVFLNIPNNPTGTIMSYEDVETIVNTASMDTLIVIDEAYYEYAKNSADYPNFITLLKSPNVIILRTFSKAYGLAGLRIGYGIANSDIIGYLNRTRPPFNVNSLAQVGALAALDDNEHIVYTIDNNNKGKEFLYRSFEELCIRYVKTYANFILFDVGVDADSIYNELLKKSVIIRSMKPYGYKTSLRVTIGTEKQNTIFIEKLKEVLGV